MRQPPDDEPGTGRDGGLAGVFSILAMDAWTYIPFLMILLLAGLQALPGEILEAARIDGAKPW